MISEQYRQKVLQRLRDMIHFCNKDNTRVYAECVLSNIDMDVDDDGAITYHDVERLIELIDRGTCHDVAKPDTAFECSECGRDYHADAEYLYCVEWEYDRPLVFEYCPFCGRRVVHAND